jgi:hypothetical protein
MDESCNLPPLASMVELADSNFLSGDKWLSVDIEEDFLDFSLPYEKPPFTLSYNGIPFAPLGGIHAQSGLSGHGKTATLCQYMAAILAGQYGGLKYELADVVPNPSVLYVDTEMEQTSTISVKNRVLTMIGRDIQQPQADFKILCLRETETSTLRWRKVLKALYLLRPTVAFIDGLLDLADDFNSNQECQQLIYKCMQIASHYKMSVWCLVHLNPNGLKLVGHLGSMLERKVTDLFLTTKDSSKGETIFSVCHKKARARDVPEWQFRVLPIDSWGRPEQLTPVTYKDEPSRIEDIREWLRLSESEIIWPASLEQVKGLIKTHSGIGGNDRLQAIVTRAVNRGFLRAQPKDEWGAKQKYPKYFLKLD